MATFRRSTWIDAPIETVWAAHSTIDGLLAVTPDWLGLGVESVRDETGATVAADAELQEGYEIDLSIVPFGVGPHQRWTSRIVARDSLGGPGTTAGRSAMFRDRMVQGPMAHWEHTHRFEAVDGGTRMTDSIEYRLPPGSLGAACSDLARIGLLPAFWYRHRVTRREFGGGEERGDH